MQAQQRIPRSSLCRAPTPSFFPSPGLWVCQVLCFGAFPFSQTLPSTLCLTHLRVAQAALRPHLGAVRLAVVGVPPAALALALVALDANLPDVLLEEDPSGSSVAPACPLGAFYFMLCEINENRGLEPNELVGETEPQWCRGPMIPTGQATAPNWCTNLCLGL